MCVVGVPLQHPQPHRPNRTARTVAASGLLLGLVACGADLTPPPAPASVGRPAATARAAGQATTYRFAEFTVCPGCPTSTAGINDQGLVGAAGAGRGYVYDSRTRTATAVPGAFVVTVPNDRGQVAGLTFGPGGTIVPLVRERDGATRVLAGYPGAAITAIIELRPNGAGLGWASADFTTFFSFVRSPDGTDTKLTYPGPVGGLTLGTFLLGWNQGGTMVGYLSDPGELEAVGVIRRRDGTWEPFAVPGALATVIYAINEAGVMVGTYRDAAGWHGFVWDRGALQTVDYPGAANTTISGINNRGELVGFTFTSGLPVAGAAGLGFVATPSPAL
jgi:hypothetical protein